jgi:hypothetical protein
MYRFWSSFPPPRYSLLVRQHAAECHGAGGTEFSPKAVMDPLCDDAVWNKSHSRKILALRAFEFLQYLDLICVELI